MKLTVNSKIAHEIQNIYKKILLRNARVFEIEEYLEKIESGTLQLPDLEIIFQNSEERKQIDTLNKIKSGPIKTKDGMNMYLDPNDYAISGYLSVHKIWEPFETFLFKQLIKKNTNFIDIGAHIGYYTLLCASKAKKGKIISFEPFTRNFKILQKNILLNSLTNVEIIEKAVSDKNQSAFLYISNDYNTGDNRIYDSEFFGLNNTKKHINISCIKLDDYLEKSKLTPDIIKMDIQGGEMKALQGMKNTLISASNLAIFCEFWPKAILATGESPQDFLETLQEYGFKILEINKSKKKLESKSTEQLLYNYTKEDNPFAQTDLLLLKNIKEHNIAKICT